jgi:hypothetical protein
MSTLEVKAIQAPTGFDLDMPAGHIIQFKSAYIESSVSSTSTDWQATGLEIDITPKFASSKIYISLQGGGAYNSTTASVSQYVTIYRGSTNLGASDYGLSRFSTSGGSWSLAPHSASVFDSPSTTSQITYQVYYKRAGTSDTIYFSHTDRGRPTLTVMEVAQ